MPVRTAINKKEIFPELHDDHKGRRPRGAGLCHKNQWKPPFPPAFFSRSLEEIYRRLQGHINNKLQSQHNRESLGHASGADLLLVPV